MAGLIECEFKEEILTELSWIMSVIDDISTKTGLETYETVLIKNRVQMQEEQAISKFFALNFNRLDALTITEIQKKIIQYYTEITKREWTLSDELVQKLVELKRQQLEV